jgi:hypothetical protein
VKILSQRRIFQSQRRQFGLQFRGIVQCPLTHSRCYHAEYVRMPYGLRYRAGLPKRVGMDAGDSPVRWDAEWSHVDVVVSKHCQAVSKDRSMSRLSHQAMVVHHACENYVHALIQEVILSSGACKVLRSTCSRVMRSDDGCLRDYPM